MRWVTITGHINDKYKYMRQYIGKLVKSSSIGKKIYWYYRLKRDSKKVFENFKITDNLEFEF